MYCPCAAETLLLPENVGHLVLEGATVVAKTEDKTLVSEAAGGDKSTGDAVYKLGFDLANKCGVIHRLALARDQESRASCWSCSPIFGTWR